MNKCLALIGLLAFMVSGCAYPQSSYADPVVDTTSNTTEERKPSADLEEDNPYINYSERYDAWRYDLHEIFRDAEPIGLDKTLYSSQDYERHIQSEVSPSPVDAQKFTYSIYLPQSDDTPPWSERLNAYYQDIMADCISESEAVFRRYEDDWHTTRLDYSYENAFQVANVLTIIRSRFLASERPTMEPFAELFSALDGSPLSIDDLFCVERDVYLPIVQEALIAAKNRFSEGYDPLYTDDHRAMYKAETIEHFEKSSVAVSPVGLVFIYPSGYVDAEAAGTVFLDVSFSVLQGVLDPILFPEGSAQHEGTVKKHKGTVPAC